VTMSMRMTVTQHYRPFFQKFPRVPMSCVFYVCIISHTSSVVKYPHMIVNLQNKHTIYFDGKWHTGLDTNGWILVCLWLVVYGHRVSYQDNLGKIPPWQLINQFHYHLTHGGKLLFTVYILFGIIHRSQSRAVSGTMHPV
jgi:hypothetical protein